MERNSLCAPSASPCRACGTSSNAPVPPSNEHAPQRSPPPPHPCFPLWVFPYTRPVTDRPSRGLDRAVA
eukprot:5545931-Prorocentrum_lima.AAC.1